MLSERLPVRFAVCACAVVMGVILFNGVLKATGHVTSGEMQQKDKWVNKHLLNPKAKMPFSFSCDGQSSDDLLRAWPKNVKSEKLDAVRSQHTLVWTDPETNLEVRCVAVEYSDYPAVEWTVYLKNTGTNDTPILQDIQGLDVVFRRSSASEFVLNGIKGDWTVAESFQPYQITLGTNAVKKFTPSNHLGKSTSGPDGWPYFNLQMPGGGVLMAVGWPGQWASSFTRDTTNGLRIKAGQQLTHLLLKSGEEIRTPLIAMLFWQGTDVVMAQNLWRRWYIAHNIPRVNGSPPLPVTHIAAVEIPVANSYLQAGIQPDICWRDANWYPSDSGPFKDGQSWLNTGTWEIDLKKHPNGFKSFSDWIHARGMKFLLWFEPERVGDPNSWLGKNHPEWLLPGESHGSLLDEGNPAALRWLINHVDEMIKSEGIDWYREDLNGAGPLPAWRKNDANDRQGVTENLYVQGHLDFWDELRRRNPRLRIDSCASGGRRNDLETMRRAVPLTRSDFLFPTMAGIVEGNQGHTYGLSFWLPFQGTGCFFYDAYSFRSFYLPSFGMAEGLSPKNTAAQQQAYAECRQIAPSMLFGDYYPLTPYSLQLDQWIAWQFNRPEEGDGVVQAFRRPESLVDSMCFKLRGLDTSLRYTVTNIDLPSDIEMTGRELMENGFRITMKNQPDSAILIYRKADEFN